MVKGGGIGLARQIEQSLDPASRGRSGRPPAAGSTAPSPASLLPAGAPGEAGPSPSTDTDGAELLREAVGGGAATRFRITSGFGLRRDPFDGRLTRHQGVDVALAEGAPIRAAAAGVVRAAGARGGYGEAVEIDHGNGLTTVYGHASELLVREGEQVAPGQAIARAGHTGRATGNHVHFEVRVRGVAVPPSKALKVYGDRVEDGIESGS